MFRSFEVKVQGTAPLLLSNVQYSDPLGPYQKKKTYFTDKKGRAKTDTVLESCRKIEWLYSGYWEQEGTVEIDEAQNTVEFEGFANPYLPASNFARACRNGGTPYKLGTALQRAVTVTSDGPLEYDGPREANAMFEVEGPKRHQLSAFTKRGVFVNRLCFQQWKTKFEVMLNDEMMDLETFRRCVNTAGKVEGLGTWRPRYGRFDVTEINELEIA